MRSLTLRTTPPGPPQHGNHLRPAGVCCRLFGVGQVDGDRINDEQEVWLPISMDLAGRVVAVTGISADGLGAGIADRFGVAGANVALLYRSAAEAATSQADRLRNLGVAVCTYRADLTDEDQVRSVFESIVADFGQLDVLVNNAGTQPVQALETMTADQWRAVVDTNATSTFLCTKHAASQMRNGGSIIHIASIEGHRMAHDHAHYSASKAAVLMHAKAAAVEYGSRGVRVNTVSPGLIDRPGLRQAWPDGVQRWEAAVPVGRVGHPTDVANACVFLASPLAEWITGADLVVDGGVSVTPTW